MEIRVNEQKLEVSFENEKTVGEVLSGMEQWLENSGHRVSGISLDGQTVSASMIEETFSKEIDTVKILDIYTNVIAELNASSLINLLEDIKEYEGINFEEKTKFFEKWEKSPAALYISAEIADLYPLCVNTFLHGNINSQTLYSHTEERLHEVNNPVDEFAKMEPLVNEICEKLVSLPLDIQTGKDLIAAGTIQIFSGVTEKIFRVFRQLDSQGFFKNIDEKKPVTQLIVEFAKVLRDFLDAYEKNDSVLLGDIAEYEASVKLKELYTAIQVQGAT
jgi:hypothetical protein